MENSESVRVAVNIRPLITTELLNGCTDCITVVPGEPQDFDLTKTYVLKIQELEGELIRLKSLNNSKRSRLSDCVDSDDGGNSKNSLFSSRSDYLSSVQDSSRQMLCPDLLLIAEYMKFLFDATIRV
ncbi:hypothetical protein V6N13_049143 [Hibiscus sabdariffa]